MRAKNRLQEHFKLILLFMFMVLQGCKSNSQEIEDFNGELVTKWNDKIIEYAIAEDNLFTLKGVRTVAMMDVAMHDALNAITAKYTTYAYKGEAPTANPIAATAQAAYEVVVSQYPDKKDELSKELNLWLNTVKGEDSKEKGIELGKASAQAILKVRNNDTWNEQSEYTWHPMSPGVYAEFNEHSGTPEGFIFGAGMSKAKTFLLTSSDHFRSPPPPEINTAEYTKAYNEVKEVGATVSTTRTKDQAHFAMWWKEFLEISMNRLADELIEKENLNLWDATRSLALLNMTIYDAYVSVFDNKFFYNHWRPYTAIRWAANDENPDTEPDTNWNTLHKHTYPFPSYPSAHGTAGAAGMTVLANTLGFGDNYKFTMVVPEVDSAGPMSEKMKMDPPERTFDSFSEAALEGAMSRLYLGIHFRYDSEEGNKLGTKIGEYASQNFLKPLE
ncbi:MAG: vanadium-dependent haloperoxidase [Flavobacteriaceae bacterium]|tara:strand:+ start:12991 stop:14322 length:1332 start_codon:yes stop_codon:yes gene_type:complete